MQVALTWCTTSGRAEEAVALLKKGMRLDPHYGDIYLQNFGYANYYARYYEDAIVAFRRIQDPGLYSHVHLALSLAQLGRKKEAAAEVAEVLKINPEFSAEEFIANDYYTYKSAQELFLDGARKAGLPICATEALLAKDPDIKHLAECDAERAHS